MKVYRTYRIKAPTWNSAAFDSETIADALRYARQFFRDDDTFDPKWLQVIEHGAWVYVD